MKWIGQHIYDLVARFRNDVYLEDLSTTTETNVLVVDSTGKVSKTTVITGDVTGVTAGSNITVTDPTGPVPTVALSTNVDVAGTLDVTSLGTFDASVTVAGNVGIGTASPEQLLHISGASGLDGATPVSSYLYSTNGGTWTDNAIFAQQLFGNADVSGDGSGGIKAKIAAYVNDTTGTTAGLSFYTSQSGTTIAERLRITSSGEVGIGTTSPDEKLHVLSSTNTVARFETSLTSDMAIELKNSQGSMFFGLGGGEEFAIGTDADLNGPNSKFVVKPSGNVGIGTAAPVNKLEIQNTTSVAGGISQGEYPLQLTNTGVGNTGVTGIAFSSQSDDTDIKSAIVFKGSTNGYNRGDIQFLMNSASDNTNVAVNTSAVLTIKDSGNVGIGTTGPSRLLHLDGVTAQTSTPFSPFLLNSRTTGNMADGFGGGVLFGINDATLTNENIIATIYGIRNGADNSGALTFNTYKAGGRSEQMRIDKDGNVGIGTTTPAQKLDVKDGFIQVSGTGPSGYGYLLNRAGQDIYSIRHLDSGLTIGNETDSRKEMTFNGTGNVGIGITTPKNKLDIVGSLGRGIPVTKTANFGVAATENWLIMNGTATITITLPTASSWTGRELMIKNIAAYTVISASSNVKPIDTDTAATAILPATAGSWCTLVSDGTNWVTMMN
jgi:hypothetical protein